MTHPDKPGTSATTSAITALRDVVMSLPPFARAVCALAIIGIAGAVAWRFGPTPPPSSTEKPKVIEQANAAPGAYSQGGQFDAHQSVDNPQNKEAAHKASEDQEAMLWHFKHGEDDPPEVEIATSSPDHRLYYKYYAKTDRCVFIRRVEADHEQSQWLLDPVKHEHDAAHAGGGAALGSLFDGGFSLPFVAVAEAQTRQPAQAGCLNPHPGQFRYWWGPPLDQCGSPMYRQFADGCMHYQVYNRCANAWDSRIFWTTCVPRHRW